ncbi:MAG: YHS domain protein [Paracoccaceae bacterium]|nr:YHS domain protein [Paracoccaceae bacterium]
MIRAALRSLAVALVLAIPAGFASADNPALVIDDQGRAVDGYDTVAYFSQGKAMAGDAAFSHNWQGATWLFTSAEHRDLFAADPERYAPQFGGYCAYAVSTNHAIKGRPDVWSIYEGKLYLNLGPGAQKKWERDVPGNIARAVNNWPGALQDPGRRKSGGTETSDR